MHAAVVDSRPGRRGRLRRHRRLRTIRRCAVERRLHPVGRGHCVGTLRALRVRRRVRSLGAGCIVPVLGGRVRGRALGASTERLSRRTRAPKSVC